MEEEQKSIEALLSDESFIKYCNGDHVATLFWQKQLEKDLLLRDHAEKAKKLLELMKSEFTNTELEAQAFGKLLDVQTAKSNFEYVNPTHEAVVVAKNYQKRWWAAAAILLVGMSVMFYLKNTTQKQSMIAAFENQQKQEIKPGRNTAVLMLDDGTRIVLDSMQNGELAKEGTTKVIKTGDGQIAYQSTGNAQAKVLYNTMSTPRGGQYQLSLPDGSLVWLNAASSIRYPTAFTGFERVVEIEGEAYFEIAHQPKMPFIVKVNNDMAVRVLGTHFNIKAYNDEPAFYTTLLEGAIKIDWGAATETIKPGQQAVLNTAGTLNVIEEVDLDEVMAWKNGLLNFSNSNLQVIMREIGRWYNVDVKYESNINERSFSGKITRNTNLSNILKILEYSGIHFRVEHNTIIVQP